LKAKGDSMLLYGKNSVLERLKAKPKSIRRIFLHNNFEMPIIKNLVKQNNIPVEHLSFRELCKIKRDQNLQGIIAEVERFVYSPFGELLNQAQNKKPTFIFLNKIFDPQNLGGIIRTAACFGGFAIVIPKFKACAVNETVLHVASGGENYISVSRVSNLSNAIISVKKYGYWIAGAVVAEDADDLNSVSLPFPLGLVLGSEGKGIQYAVQKHLDIKMRIPMKGANLSFNVTGACAILCYEIAKQRSDVYEKQEAKIS